MSWDGPVALGQPLQVLVLRVNWNYHNLNTGLLCEFDESPPALGPRSSPFFCPPLTLPPSPPQKKIGYLVNYPIELES